VLNTSLLLHVRQGLKKAVLTEVYLKALTIVVAAIPPVGLQGSVLVTARSHARRNTADVTRDISNGLNLDSPGNFHSWLLEKGFDPVDR